MAIKVGTHSGTFHADDVLAFALLRSFVDPQAEVVRSRDRERLMDCDFVVDVGGEYDPSRLRFDHHQASYVGPCSSAGMILDWLADTGRIEPDLVKLLRDRVVNYIDAVDTGREAPRVDVPCFARIVEALGQGITTPEEQQAMFLRAADIASVYVDGLVRGLMEVRLGREIVRRAMEDAVAARRSFLVFERYHPWKQIYFDLGGEAHPTDFVLFPSEDETWKLVAIPPALGRFEQKRSLPESWAGRMGAELEASTGVPGSLFCHKNRFIAVFQTLEGAIEALRRFGMYDARSAEASQVTAA